MSNLNTELMETLLKNESFDEFFRSHLENAINDLLQNELTAFLGYEKHSVDGYGTGNSRNGSNTRGLDTKYGKLELVIPRDRNGNFDPGRNFPHLAFIRTICGYLHGSRLYWDALDQKVRGYCKESGLEYVRNDDSMKKPIDAPPTVVNFFYHEEIKKSAQKK